MRVGAGPWAVLDISEEPEEEGVQGAGVHKEVAHLTSSEVDVVVRYEVTSDGHPP